MKKLLALLLVLVMLFSMFACTNTEEPKDSESDSQPADSQSDSESKETEPEVVLNKFGVEDRTFDGRSFRIWHANANIGLELMYATEYDGTSLTKSVVDRIADVEETFDVVIEHTRLQAWGPDVEAIANMVATGKNEADLVNSGDVADIQMRGILHNVADEKIENFDYSDVWWTSKVMDSYRIGDSQFLLAGSFTYANWWDIRCVYFNKTVFDELGVEYPYQLVKDGKWTLDKALELTENRYQDIDGKEGKTNNDFYGWAYNGYQYGWAEVLGIQVISEDETGNLVYNFDAQHYATVAQKMIDLMDSTRGWNIAKGGARDGFKAGRVMFVHDAFNRTHEWWGPANTKFGILPAPKVTEDQADYRCGGGCHYFMIPTTIQDSSMDFVTFMINGFAAAGHKYLFPTYFEYGLKTRYSSDNDDALMFDIVHATNSINIGFEFGLKTGDLIANCMKPGTVNATTEFASFIAEWQAKDIEYMNGINAAFHGQAQEGLYNKIYG